MPIFLLHILFSALSTSVDKSPSTINLMDDVHNFRLYFYAHLRRSNLNYYVLNFSDLSSYLNINEDIKNRSSFYKEIHEMNNKPNKQAQYYIKILAILLMGNDNENSVNGIVMYDEICKMQFDFLKIVNLSKALYNYILLSVPNLQINDTCFILISIIHAIENVNLLKKIFIEFQDEYDKFNLCDFNVDFISGFATSLEERDKKIIRKITKRKTKTSSGRIPTTKAFSPFDITFNINLFQFAFGWIIKNWNCCLSGKYTEENIILEFNFYHVKSHILRRISDYRNIEFIFDFDIAAIHIIHTEKLEPNIAVKLIGKLRIIEFLFLNEINTFCKSIKIMQPEELENEKIKLKENLRTFLSLEILRCNSIATSKFTVEKSTELEDNITEDDKSSQTNLVLEKTKMKTRLSKLVPYSFTESKMRHARGGRLDINNFPSKNIQKEVFVFNYTPSLNTEINMIENKEIGWKYPNQHNKVLNDEKFANISILHPGLLDSIESDTLKIFEPREILKTILEKLIDVKGFLTGLKPGEKNLNAVGKIIKIIEKIEKICRKELRIVDLDMIDSIKKLQLLVSSLRNIFPTTVTKITTEVKENIIGRINIELKEGNLLLKTKKNKLTDFV